MVSFPFIDKQRSQNPPDFFNRNSEKQRRLDGYKKAWEAYLAELPDPVRVENGVNDNVKSNPLRAIVEVGVYFLFGDEVRFELSPQQATDKKKTEAKDQGPSSLDSFKSGSKPDTAAADSKTTEAPQTDDKPKGDDPKGSVGKKPDDHQIGDPVHAVLENDPAILEDPPYVADLDKIWKANRKKAFLNEMGLSGGIHGDVFVKFIPNGAGPKLDMPRLVLLDPANVDVFTHPDDCTRVIKWVITYNTEDEQGRPITREQEITPVAEEADEYGVERITKWEIKDYETNWGYDTQLGWIPSANERQQVGATKEWPYAWAPIEHCNNLNLPHMFWGLGDFDESAIELVQGIQRAMSSLNKIVRLHASPRLFAKGVMPELAGQIDASPDGVITLPAGAGVDSDLKILEGLANMDSQIAFVESMRKQLLEALRIPPIALGDINTMSTSMSGITMAVLYAPIIQKTDLKRIEYGDMLDRINKKLLILHGYEDAMDYDDLIVVWPEAMPGSSYVERQTLLEDQTLGVSNYTSMKRLGYDPDREAARKMTEMRAEQELKSEFQMRQMEKQAELMPPPPPDMGGDPRGGNNNPAGVGNRGGSMGASGNSTPKNKENPSTPKSRGGQTTANKPRPKA